MQLRKNIWFVEIYKQIFISFTTKYKLVAKCNVVRLKIDYGYQLTNVRLKINENQKRDGTNQKW